MPVLSRATFSQVFAKAAGKHCGYTRTYADIGNMEAWLAWLGLDAGYLSLDAPRSVLGGLSEKHCQEAASRSQRLTGQEAGAGTRTWGSGGGRGHTGHPSHSRAQLLAHTNDTSPLFSQKS